MADIPASVDAEGSRRVVFITAAADVEAITVAEITAGDDVSCYITGNGWQPGGDQGTITDTRLCSSTDFERPGRKTKTLTIQYTVNFGTPADDVARLNLVEGTAGYLVNFLQVDEDATLAANDWYEAWPVTLGEQMMMPPEANAVDRITQKAFVTGPVAKFHQLVA